MIDRVIRLAHGDGGTHTRILIQELFFKYFHNPKLKQSQDSGFFSVSKGRLAFTTDSFVVKPLFFAGGNIGKLAVCGTINDLVVSGAKPLYLSASFIIEEGFSLPLLEKIVVSMGQIAFESGVKIITGDTKVVEKGRADGVYINTTGIGKVIDHYTSKSIEAGDSIIVTGSIGEHGTIMAIERYFINVKRDFQSDCAVLYPIVEKIRDFFPIIKIMRDPSNGGLATVLHEFSAMSQLPIHLWEDQIPIKEEVKGINKLLGLDPLYMACEGCMVLVVKPSYTNIILKKLSSIEQGKDAREIGVFLEPNNNLEKDDSIMKFI